MDIETLINELNKANDDNKKFALLLILTQLIKTNKIKEFDEKNNENLNANSKQSLKERLFLSINPHFLARLITTTQVPQNCSKSIFKSVSINILIKFNEYKHLICDPIILSKIKDIINILKENLKNLYDLESKIKAITSGNTTDTESIKIEINMENSLIEATFNYLFALSKHCSNYLCKNGLLKVLFDDYIISEKLYSSSYSDFIDIATQLFIKLLDFDINNANFECKLEIFSVIDNYLEILSSNQTEFKFHSIKLFNKLAKFEQFNVYMNKYCKSNDKNHYLNILSDLIRNFKSIKPHIKLDLFEFIDFFMNMDINKQNDEITGNATIESEKDETGSYLLNKLYSKDKKLFYLFAHLVSIEIRLILEDNTIDLTKSPNATIMSQLSIYYNLFEKLIIFLSISPSIDVDNDTQQINNLLNIFIETINTIILFLKDSLNAIEGAFLNSLIIISTIRVLACWFSFEELLENEIIDLLNDNLIKFCDYYTNMSKSVDNSSDITININFVNIYKFIVPGLKRFISNNESTIEFMLSHQDNKDYDEDFIDRFNIVKNLYKHCENKIQLIDV